MSKDEEKLGSIEPGKLADLVILDRDILTVPHEEIKEIETLTTIVDGKVVYQKR
jgi:predicted amidohydrolase YtcJ